MDEKKLLPKRRFKEFSKNDEWMYYSWEDTVDISINMVDPKNDKYSNFPHIGPGNIESFTGLILDNVNTVKEDNLISGKFYFNAGDIIYGKINPQLGKYTYAPYEGLASADTYILNSKNGLNQRFLFMLLQTKHFFNYSVSVSKRSGMPKINRDELNEYTFCAPSTKEQQKIGKFFKVLDERIANQERKIAKVKALKSAYLTEMFPQEGETVPKRRFAGFEGEWKEMCLGDLSDSFDYGLNAESKKYDGENKYIRITDIDDDTRLFVKNDLTSPNIDYTISDRYILDEGDILFARTGASVGKTYRYNKLDGKVYYAGFLIKATIKDEHDSEFIFQNTLTKKYKNFVYITSQRSGQPGINAQEYATYKLMIPTLKEQQKIGKFFKKLDVQITIEEKKLEKLKKIKEAYLEEMFV
ncbi:type I restriction enzyme, S subunit [Niallia circulans]|uniref:restriction endonuclease subunit S n=1 Tax=Niallia circulans TaxID=1397 RepID=UPI00077C5603|nr:restriction endonuclease subunit S [Niallia circulans]MDR4318640.1 restriction endonuclease subunit S [Niallia circulans]MED3839400.1 restriction endonuclease subunit S [Niallia circulans]MED4245383.1 restriction endonuclease subunit S [Niallia circulans]MED4250918.1 restriction endonuclease subunit S [Niallia circulans]QKH60195.1 restriction endonuclease subunit S [Niallia circulans]